MTILGIILHLQHNRFFIYLIVYLTSSPPFSRNQAEGGLQQQ